MQFVVRAWGAACERKHQCLHACSYVLFYSCVPVCMLRLARSWINLAVYSVHYKARSCLQQWIYAALQLASFGHHSATVKQDLQQIPQTAISLSHPKRLSCNVQKHWGALDPSAVLSVLKRCQIYTFSCLQSKTGEDPLSWHQSTHPGGPHILARKPPSESVYSSSSSLALLLSLFQRKLRLFMSRRPVAVCELKVVVWALGLDHIWMKNIKPFVFFSSTLTMKQWYKTYMHK